MKKRKKLPRIRTLQRKAERFWKDVCLRRDGRECQVKKFFPEVKIKHSDVMQVDHCFQRGDKNLFLEPSNGTVVCSSCNLLKSFGYKSVGRLVDIIVMRRECVEKYIEMLKISSTSDPNPGWRDRKWLNNKILELDQILKNSKNNT